MNQPLTVEISNDLPWLNPVGGYGDMLMVAGVLKQAIDQDPSRRFNLVRRSRYLAIFNEHEAICKIGFPKKKEKIVGVDYWSMEKLGGGNQRPYQILARKFGLDTPIEEKLYLPGNLEEDPLLHNFLPWKQINVVIAPASDSPRKEMLPNIWHQLVEKLKADDMFVMQAGLLKDLRILNAYSVRGLTTPNQLVALIKKCDLVVTCDNFIMHAAHLAGIPAVVVWGPTQHEVYGYPEQTHIQMSPNCELEDGESCIVSQQNQNGRVYGTPCPLGENCCMNQTTPETLYEACIRTITSRRAIH